MLFRGILLAVQGKAWTREGERSGGALMTRSQSCNTGGRARGPGLRQPRTHTDPSPQPLTSVPEPSECSRIVQWKRPERGRQYCIPLPPPPVRLPLLSPALQLAGALDLSAGSCAFEESTCGFDSVFEFLPWILNEEGPAQTLLISGGVLFSESALGLTVFFTFYPKWYQRRSLPQHNRTSASFPAPRVKFLQKFCRQKLCSGSIGHYIYVDTSFAKQGEKAVLLSSDLQAEEWSCLRLVYQITTSSGSPSVPSRLNLYVRYEDESFDRLLWSAKEPSDSWLIASLDLQNSPKKFKILIEGVLGQGNTASIALFEIKMTTGYCIECDFEENHLCGFVNRWNPNVNWFVGGGNIRNSHSVLPQDHTFKSELEKEGERGGRQLVQTTMTQMRTSQREHKRGQRGRITAESEDAFGIAAKPRAIFVECRHYAGGGGPLGVGHYMYVDSVYVKHFQEVAQLISPMTTAPMSGCLSFYYQRQQGNDHIFSVYTRDVAGVYEEIWKMGSPGSAAWNLAEVEFSAPYPMEVIFEVAFNGPKGGYVALDDISFSPVHCQNQTGYFLLANTKFTSQPGYIGRLYGPSLPGNLQYCLRFYYAIYGFLKMSDTLAVYIFEENHVVQEKIWSVLESPRGVWMQAEITFKKPMPTKVVFMSLCKSFWDCGLVALDDITVELGSCWSPGYYMYIEASHMVYGQKAQLLSGPLRGVTGKHCLTFFYHMYGAGTGLLNVYLKKEGDSEETLLWRRGGEQCISWLRALIEYSCERQHQIIFEAIRGMSVRSDIAIDDVKFQAGPCAEMEDKTQQSSGYSEDLNEIEY
ncbi:hypothetical protein CB1_000063003 [Camelus ferus]|nr:hypothetical protein CB1_000063003 [Camelus ferus]